MPSNLLKLSSSSLESESHHEFERSGSFDSQGSHHSRSRSSTLDDENLRYLTSEEKNVLMFLEETLDAFEDDVEESPVALNSSFDYSAMSKGDNHSDTEDIIDLVQKENNGVGISLGSGLSSSVTNHTHHDSLSEATSTSSPMILPAETTHRDEDIYSSELPDDHPKLLGAIPTPVIIAQNISTKKTENGHLPLILPKDEKLPELKKSVATSPISDSDFAFLNSPVAKLSRFPNNISVKRAGKEYNNTIAKAAVNVQERRAKVLANLHGPGLAEEIDGKIREPMTRKTSFRDVDPEQARYIALTKLGLINEVHVQADLYTTSVCTSPVSSGLYSPTFSLPESQRRLSNEQVRYNSQQSVKVLSSELNKNISHEQHLINGKQSSRFSNEQQHFNGPQSSKLMSPESNKKFPQELSPKALAPESSKNVSPEQHSRSGQLSPKVLAPESSNKVSHEQHFINDQQSTKILLPEPSKKTLHEHNFVSGQSAEYFPSETKRRPSKEHDDIVGQYSTKSVPSESNRTITNEQESISSILMSAHSSFIPLGKTVVIKGETSSPDKSKENNSIQINYEEKPNTRQEIKRIYSVPRPTGFRPQGITVQFSGRNSSEESRKDALRKLGLLKEEFRP